MATHVSQSQSGTDVVVARYNEDVGWLSELTNRCDVWLYNKGSVLPIATSSVITYAKLPNVGREAHTYLTHVIRNYDAMAVDGVTVFCQGRISDHVSVSDDHHAVAVAAMAEEARRHGCSTSRFRTHPHDVDSRYQPSEWFRISEWPAGTALSPNSGGQGFGEWFRAHVRPAGLPALEDLRWAVGAVFAIRNDRILSRPKQYYVELLDAMGTARDPETAHFLERSWWYVFACDELGR